MRSLPRAVAATPIGKSVAVELLRKGQPMDLTVTVGRLPEGEEVEDAVQSESEEEPAPEPEREDLLGLSIAPLTEELRERYGIGKSIEGVVITEVKPNSPAAQKNVKPGDVIVEVTQEKVKQPQDVKSRLLAVQEIRAAIGAAAAVRRQGRAPLRRRADELGPCASPAAQGHSDCRADRERQVGRRARACARDCGGTVINANSMQVYRELAVLTARPSPADDGSARRTVSTARSLPPRPIRSAAGSKMRRTPSPRRADAGQRADLRRRHRPLFQGADRRAGRRSPTSRRRSASIGASEAEAHGRRTASIASLPRAIPPWRRGSGPPIRSASCARSK